MTEEASKDSGQNPCFRWFQRTFGAMAQGSVRASIFILASTAMGAGFMPDVLNSLNISFPADRQAVLVVAMVCFVTPLGLFRKLAVQRYKALFNVTCLTYILILVIAQFPYYSSQYGFGEIVYGKRDLKVFSAFSMCLFAYLCQQNLTRVAGELKSQQSAACRK